MTARIRKRRKEILCAGWNVALRGGLPGGREMAGGDGFAEQLLDGCPEDGGAIGDGGVTALGLIVGDVVLAPTAAVRAGVEQHGLEAVAGVGEFRFGCGARFELIPEGAELAGLIVRQEAEDAVGGAGFAIVLVDHGGGVVGEGVAGVDFNKVMNETHFEDAQDVEVRDVCMLREDHDAQAESPRVFGVVFGAATLRVDCLAENFLQLVALGDEGDLLGEALHGGFGGRDHARHQRHEHSVGNAGARSGDGGHTQAERDRRKRTNAEELYFNSGARRGVQTA